MNDSMPRWLRRRGSVLILLILGTGCPDSASAPTAGSPSSATPSAASEEAVPDWATAFQSKVRFDGEKQAVVVDLKIAPGFHAYTVGEATGKPLAVSLADDGAYTLNGNIEYPKGTAKQLPIGPSVIVEGEAKITAPVVRRTEAQGNHVKGTLRYQVCTDQACDRPRKRSFDVQATPSDS